MAIILSVLALLLLLLLLPVTLHVTLFDGELQTTVRYLFLRFRFPSERGEEPKADKPPKRRRKKKQKKQEAPQEQKEKEPEEKKWDFEAVKNAIELGKELLAGAGKALKTLLRGVRVRQLKLEIAVVGENAADTGIKSGNYNAYLHTAAALLQNFVRVRELYLNVYPAFWQQEETIAFEGKLSLRPVRALMAAGVLLIESIPALLRYLRRKNGAADAQPREEQAPAAAGDK